MDTPEAHARSLQPPPHELPGPRARARGARAQFMSTLSVARSCSRRGSVRCGSTARIRSTGTIARAYSAASSAPATCAARYTCGRGRQWLPVSPKAGHADGNGPHGCMLMCWGVNNYVSSCPACASACSPTCSFAYSSLTSPRRYRWNPCRPTRQRALAEHGAGCAHVEQRGHVALKQPEQRIEGGAPGAAVRRVRVVALRGPALGRVLRQVGVLAGRCQG